MFLSRLEADSVWSLDELKVIHATLELLALLDKGPVNLRTDIGVTQNPSA
jgi:hypothetical protein